MNIEQVLERARERVQPNSERELARHLRVEPVQLLRWSRKTARPSDNAMIRLSDAAGITPEEGLLLLNMWRSDGEAAAIYGRMHKQLLKNGDSRKQEQRKERRNTKQ
ncbi:MAG TPA: hypothetical protein VGG10_15230 [Rhizomicrobium sp.]|jgi:hypothetical protein